MSATHIVNMSITTSTSSTGISRITNTSSTRVRFKGLELAFEDALDNESIGLTTKDAQNEASNDA